MKARQHETSIIAAQLDRPTDGPTFNPQTRVRGFDVSCEPAWQSNGGPVRGHAARSLPFSFDLRIPEGQGQLLRVHLIGVFALFSDRPSESLGTLGGSIQLLSGENDVSARFNLINGRHYGDARELDRMARVIGDGTSVESVGSCTIRGEESRVDILTLDVPQGSRPRRFHFKDLGSPASFVVFDVFFEFEGTDGENAPTREGHLSLGEIGAAVRVGDRVKFSKALDQLDQLIDEAEGLDETRAQALSFLGVIFSALQETSARKNNPQFLLDCARLLDSLKSRGQVKETLRHRVGELTSGHFSQSESPSDRLVDRALAIVERHYAKDLTDAIVASQLGLSTSHFRYLFRQATGHPFHKYVVALRLEKAKQMLIEQELPVSQVATAVGFTGLSHFSRAFTQRFSASPSHIRRAAG